MSTVDIDYGQFFNHKASETIAQRGKYDLVLVHKVLE